MWFLRRLEPDSKTIGNFRKDNALAIRGVCKQFIFYCRQPPLFGVELIVVDGSKLEAVNTHNCNFSARKPTSQTEQIEAKIREYLEDLEANDE